MSWQCQICIAWWLVICIQTCCDGSHVYEAGCMKHEARVWKQLILNLKARDNFEDPAVGTISF